MSAVRQIDTMAALPVIATSGRMGLRFRRSFKLAPGLRMNLSRSGLSWSVGPRGASMSYGKRGIASNLGLPGTGLSYRQSQGAKSRTRESGQPLTGSRAATVSIDDDGNVSYVDSSTGQLLDQAWIELGKKQHADLIKRLISDKVAEINAAIDTLGSLHRFSPPPVEPTYEKAAFDLPRPSVPVEKTVGLLGKMFSSKRDAIEQENEQTKRAWQGEMTKWEQLKAAHDAREDRNKRRFEEEVRTDVDAMEGALQENIESIEWPRETDVSFEIRAGGALCVLDVDLPEIEDMPSVEAATTGRGFDVKKVELSETRRRKVYMRHIHSIALRLIAEVFATLPRCEKVILSGYSQRHSTATGQLQDEYLLSVTVDRNQWRGLDFTAFDKIDPVAAVERFECRRKMTKTGVFSAIEPLA